MNCELNEIECEFTMKEIIGYWSFKLASKYKIKFQRKNSYGNGEWVNSGKTGMPHKNSSENNKKQWTIRSLQGNLS